MKKIIGFLALIVVTLFNIESVKAEDGFLDHIEGTCTLGDSTLDSCEYSCNVSQDSAYYNFKYKIVYDKSGTFSHNIYDTDADGVGFPKDSSYSFICGTTLSDCIALDHKLVSTPREDIFIKGDQIICRKVIPMVTTHVIVSGVNPEKPLLHPGTSTVQNEITIFADPDELDEAIKKPDGDVPTNGECGILGDSTSKIVQFLKKIYSFIKILIPILIVAMGIVDFIKVVLDGKDDDMKKAINKLTKRIILGVVFILIPFLISLLITISGINAQYDSINDGVKALFCILK